MHAEMPIGPVFRRTGTPRKLAALLADERGATAVELALLAIPFFALIVAILETAVVFLASQFLDSAVQDASRLILTGQAQSDASFDIESFRHSVCNELYGMFDCSKLQIRVSTVDNFASADVAPPLDPNDPSKWKLEQAFLPGSGMQVVMVQVYYKWPVIVRFAGFNLATSSDGTRLLGAVRVFANEPFSSGGVTG
jgi:Flp pilus assembly protein TadG